MKSAFSVTFEFVEGQPVTEKGTVEGTSVRTLAARALDIAVDKNPNTRWNSVVIVLDRDRSLHLTEE